MTLSSPIENIRLSERERDSLVQIKRLTGIEHWNVLCRWALCLSLAEGRLPETGPLTPSDSSVEMSWKTLVGETEAAILALLGMERGSRERSALLRRHLMRGVALLHARTQSDPGARRADALRILRALGP